MKNLIVKQYTIKVTEETYEKVKSLAEKRKTTMGAVVGELSDGNEARSISDLYKRFDQYFAFMKAQELKLIVPMFEKVMNTTTAPTAPTAREKANEFHSAILFEVNRIHAKHLSKGGKLTEIELLRAIHDRI